MTFALFILSAAVIALGLSVIMTGAWLIRQRTGNSGWVDTVWTFGLGLEGIGAALLLPPHNFPPREMVVAVLIALWAARLGIPLLHACVQSPPRALSLRGLGRGRLDRSVFLHRRHLPSHNLPRQFSDLFDAEQDWLWDGIHYERTALDWLANFDARRDEVEPVLQRVYGADAALWLRRWRVFFLATAGMFGHAGGREWGVSHDRMRAA